LFDTVSCCSTVFKHRAVQRALLCIACQSTTYSAHHFVNAPPSAAARDAEFVIVACSALRRCPIVCEKRIQTDDANAFLNNSGTAYATFSLTGLGGSVMLKYDFFSFFLTGN